MPTAINSHEFPNVMSNLDRLHFSSNVQNVFKKESDTNPALIVKLLESLPQNQRVRTPAREDILIKGGGGDPLALIKYMNLMNMKKWPEAEDVLASTVKSAVAYYQLMGDVPFPKGEPMIATQGNFAFIYAVDILKSRFPMGEEAIKARPPKVWQAYVSELKEFAEKLRSQGKRVPDDFIPPEDYEELPGIKFEQPKPRRTR